MKLHQWKLLETTRSGKTYLLPPISKSTGDVGTRRRLIMIRFTYMEGASCLIGNVRFENAHLKCLFLIQLKRRIRFCEPRVCLSNQEKTTAQPSSVTPWSFTVVNLKTGLSATICSILIYNITTGAESTSNKMVSSHFTRPNVAV